MPIVAERFPEAQQVIDEDFGQAALTAPVNLSYIVHRHLAVGFGGGDWKERGEGRGGEKEGSEKGQARTTATTCACFALGRADSGA